MRETSHRRQHGFIKGTLSMLGAICIVAIFFWLLVNLVIRGLSSPGSASTPNVAPLPPQQENQERNISPSIGVPETALRKRAAPEPPLPPPPRYEGPTVNPRPGDAFSN